MATCRSARAPSSMNLHVLRGRFSSLFRHTESNTDGATELQQRPKRTIFSRGPRIVEVAAVRDKEALFVAPPPAQQTQQQNQSHGQGSSTTPPPPGTNTTTPGARPTHSLPLRLLAHLVLFLCCAYPQHADGNAQSTQQQQQQANHKAQSSLRHHHPKLNLPPPRRRGHLLLLLLVLSYQMLQTCSHDPFHCGLVSYFFFVVRLPHMPMVINTVAYVQPFQLCVQFFCTLISFFRSFRYCINLFSSS
ncbi:hypothetical protein EDB19DRAFT_260708 [Suillus lakei]|nr:hypothetical protein EDB19DRAFT_260708 [Suillus lakei]